MLISFWDSSLVGQVRQEAQSGFPRFAFTRHHQGGNVSPDPCSAPTQRLRTPFLAPFLCKPF